MGIMFEQLQARWDDEKRRGARNAVRRCWFAAALSFLTYLLILFERSGR